MTCFVALVPGQRHLKQLNKNRLGVMATMSLFSLILAPSVYVNHILLASCDIVCAGGSCDETRSLVATHFFQRCNLKLK